MYQIRTITQMTTPSLYRARTGPKISSFIALSVLLLWSITVRVQCSCLPLPPFSQSNHVHLKNLSPILGICPTRTEISMHVSCCFFCLLLSVAVAAVCCFRVHAVCCGLSWILQVIYSDDTTYLQYVLSTFSHRQTDHTYSH
jgi:hypothetical protein